MDCVDFFQNILNSLVKYSNSLYIPMFKGIDCREEQMGNRKQRGLMKKLVHTREISMRTSDLGDHTIVVEGDLIDHRYRPMQNKESEESELVHHMVIQLKVKGPSMSIEQAVATMPHHPRSECPEMLPSI